MAIRLIVSDLDGTLIGSSLQVSDRTVRAFAAAREKGVMTTIATGRQYGAMSMFAERLGIDIPVITCQGAEILEAKTGRPYWQERMPLEAAKEFLKAAEDLGIYAQFYTTAGYFIEEENETSRRYARLAGVSGIPVGAPLREKLPPDVLKAIMIAPEEKVAELYPVFRKRFEGRLNVTVSLPILLEAASPKVNKANALKKYAEHMGIGMDEIMAFGDAPNDAEMLSAVGYGVAVGNGDAIAKAAAKYGTEPMEDDGVARAIERFVLGEG